MCYTDCYNQPEHLSRELRTDEIRRILDELAEAGCLELCLTGGEPLARTDFIELYEHAARKGFLITLFTNGTLITERIADRLAALPPHQVEVSMHAASADLFDRITSRSGSYERCLEGLRLLRDRNLPVTVKSTAMTINKHDLLTVKALTQARGTGRFKLGEELRPSLDGSDGPQRFQLSAGELDELNRRDPDLHREACRAALRNPGPCRSGLRSCHIDAYGRLQLCSGNRMDSFDLRRGSFHEGFFEHLPRFACPWKIAQTPGTRPAYV
jgi:MoaA/NifB/PqqE/SkfB family radical SAM enzyme